MFWNARSRVWFNGFFLDRVSKASRPLIIDILFGNLTRCGYRKKLIWYLVQHIIWDFKPDLFLFLLFWNNYLNNYNDSVNRSELRRLSWLYHKTLQLAVMLLRKTPNAVCKIYKRLSYLSDVTFKVYFSNGIDTKPREMQRKSGATLNSGKFSNREHDYYRPFGHV